MNIENIENEKTKGRSARGKLCQGDGASVKRRQRITQFLSDPRLLQAPAIAGATLICGAAGTCAFCIFLTLSIFTMSAPGAGHEFPAKAVSWQKRDVLLFANSIGIKADELHFLYVRHLPPCGIALSDRSSGTSSQFLGLPDLPFDPSYVDRIPIWSWR